MEPEMKSRILAKPAIDAIDFVTHWAIHAACKEHKTVNVEQKIQEVNHRFKPVETCWSRFHHVRISTSILLNAIRSLKKEQAAWSTRSTLSTLAQAGSAVTCCSTGKGACKASKGHLRSTAPNENSEVTCCTMVYLIQPKYHGLHLCCTISPFSILGMKPLGKIVRISQHQKKQLAGLYKLCSALVSKWQFLALYNHVALCRWLWQVFQQTRLLHSHRSHTTPENSDRSMDQHLVCVVLACVHQERISFQEKYIEISSKLHTSLFCFSISRAFSRLSSLCWAPEWECSLSKGQA